MSRDDIPEVFRRAMEEAGWDEDNTHEDRGGDGRPPLENPFNSPRFNRILWLIGFLALLLFSFGWIINTYTEWLWFIEVKYAAVWLKQWLVRAIVFAAGFIIAAAFLFINLHVARRRAVKETSPFNPQFLQFRWLVWLINAVVVVLGLFFAGAAGSQWLDFLRQFYQVPFGLKDPTFNLDVSFYLFNLPVYRFLQGWVLALLVITLLTIIPIYAINNLPDIQNGSWRPDKSPAFRKHVALVGALFLAIWASGYIIALFNLLYSSRGVVVGASYTDLFATRWALWAQMLFMGLAALSLLLLVFRVSFRPLVISLGLWLAATVLLGWLYPGILQRYAVEPNEIERERPYIADNIAFTRRAFNLDKIETRPFDLSDDLNASQITENQALLTNIRLWDYRPLQATYEQLQALRPYYEFSGIDIDRYEINGEVRQVMLAARELNKANLPAPSWVNRNLEFTHGYGIVMNPVDRFTAEGQPEFFIKDLPPQSNIDIQVERAEIYYGERTTDTVFVSSGREEFSYPSGNKNVYSSYAGEGGVPLNNFFRRLAFALRFSDTNILLSTEIDSGTKVQFNRQILTRVRQITPFLALDSDPYLVIDNGRLFWMLDAYTVSNDFPYATPTNANGFNYIRNAAKVTIDAYHGTVTYYLADDQDPLVRAYAAAFPGLFHPLSEMPAGLQSHIRYPTDMFRVQTRQYLTYHMTDERVFYNKEDLWQLPTEIVNDTEQELEPYYVILPLPGDTKAEYLLIQPYTPAEKNNMIAWLAARNDVPNYGQLIVYELPKQRLIFGPIQIEGRIDQEPEISQQFSLWDQRGSQVLRGNLLVIPFQNNFLYVEPIYLLSETSALPELRRVIVATNTQVVMAETLADALALLVQQKEEAATEAASLAVETPVEPAQTEEAASPPAEDTGGAITGAGELDVVVQNVIRSANSHFAAAEQAQREGNWAKYGQELEGLRSDLELLSQLTGTAP